MVARDSANVLPVRTARRAATAAWLLLLALSACLQDVKTPHVRILSPTAFEETCGSVGTIEVDAYDESGIARVVFRVGGREVATLTEPPFVLACTPQTCPVEPGEVEIEATAHDTEGNEASDTVSVTVVAPPPGGC